MALDQDHGILYLTETQVLSKDCRTTEITYANFLSKVDLKTGQSSRLYPLGNSDTGDGFTAWFFPATGEYVHEASTEPAGPDALSHPFLQLINVHTGAIRTIDLPENDDYIWDWGR
jgi:hypothetical protein